MSAEITLERILKELYNISGFRISIYDTEFNEIIAYPQKLSCYCSLIQESPEGKQKCVQNDINAFEKVQTLKNVYIYKCHFGLCEAVTPLYSFDTLTGYLMMGQYLDDNSESMNNAFYAAFPYTKDKNRLSEALKQVPVSSKETIQSVITIMNVCAQYITLSNRLNHQKQDLAMKTKEYLDINYSRKITIGLLCSHFFCSKSTLHTHFKAKFHKGINQYLTEIRIHHGENYLRNSKKTIGEITSLCGFSDQNYFTKAFTKHKNMSPTEFRKSCETDNERETPKAH